jgi:hypothetical protein
MEIIVTTGDLKYAYSIIQPVFVQISNKGILKNQYDHLEVKHKNILQGLQEKGILPKEDNKKRGTIAHQSTSSTGHKMERAFYLALEEIKIHAQQLGGQAVVYMRYETDFVDSLPNEFYLQMYGTVVKFEV